MSSLLDILPQSNGGEGILGPVKSVKFFLQFQIARVKAAQGVTLTGAGTVQHQAAKTITVSVLKAFRSSN
jgi:hypothetical protein